MKKRFLKLSALCLSAGISFAGISVTSLAAEEADAADPVGTIGFAQCSEYLNVRSDADKDAEVIGKLYNNGSAEILEADENGWYHIRSGNVDGYVSSEYIATGEEADEIAAATGYTTAEVGAISLNVRSEANETSDVVGSASESQELEVVAEEENGDWVKVVLPEGVYGYVSTEYVHVSTEYPTAVTLEEEQAAAKAAAAQEAADAQAAADAESAAWENPASEEQSYDQAQEDTYTEDDQWDESSADTAVDDSYAAADAGTASEDSYTDAASEDTYTDTAAADTAADTGSADTAYTDTSAGDAAAADAGASSDAGYTDTSASDSGYTDEVAGADTTTDTAADTTVSTGSATGQAIVNYASQFVSNPYVWGGTSLTDGADCSGFVLSVFANFGISLPHSAASQAGYGTEVSYSDLQPGDLVFYSDGSGISHVAIYAGGGSIVHAANAASGICYSNVDYSTPVSCRRLV